MRVASVVLFIAIGFLGGRPAHAQTTPLPPTPTTIPAMWDAWCARCHAKDGTGKVVEPTVTVRPRDFTQCSSATGEADPDWALAIAKGGPAVGLSDQMPAFGDSITAAQVDGFVAQLRSFCRESGWPDGNLNLPRPVLTEKAFPEDELVIAPVASHVQGQPTSWTFATIFEKRIAKRFQLELDLPVSSVSGPDGRATGYGDTEIGMKFVLNPNAHQHLATFGLDVVVPTGNESEGLSEGAGFEPYIATASAWGTTYLQMQFKLELPKDGGWNNKVGVYRTYVGHDLNLTPRGWTLGVELTGENSDAAITPQFRKGLSPTGAIALGFGVSLPISHRDEQGVAYVGFLLWEFLERPYISRH